jgi:hypothetical protein
MRFGAAWAGFAPKLDQWLTVTEGRGPAAVQQVYLDTLNGRVPPDQAGEMLVNLLIQLAALVLLKVSAQRAPVAEPPKKIADILLAGGQAYAELSTLAQSSGWSLFHGKNDLWVGAAAHTADAQLLTMDTDFLPLRGRPGWQIIVLDDKTGLPRP